MISPLLIGQHPFYAVTIGVMRKIIVDIMGGDNAPEAPLAAVSKAYHASKELSFVLVGKKEIMEAYAKKEKWDASRVEIVDAQDVVTNEDHPATFLQVKPNSSLAVAFDQIAKRDDIDGMVSSGPTGALLTGGIFKAKRLDGVKRPALIATLPTKVNGQMVRLVDAGANMDSKPEYLVQFALMADAYAKVLGIASPRIGLLSVGMEEGKGNELTKDVYAKLKAISSLNFVGNVEGDKVLDGICDIVIADGFAGNVFLKATEGGAYFVKGLFTAALKRNIFSKFGVLFQLKGIKEAKKPFAAASSACAPLLGCRKLIVKCHGKADKDTLFSGILETARYADEDLLGKISDAIASQAE